MRPSASPVAICNHSMAPALLHPTQHKQGSSHLGMISLRSLLQRAGSKLGDKQEPKCQRPDILVFWGLSINRPLWENGEHETQGEMRLLEQQLLGYWAAR